MAEIAHGYGAYLMVDMAHIAGLVAAGLHQSPVPYADVVTTTTHKTLRGPRGGVILTNDEELAKKFNKAIFPGTQGGPLEHVIAAKAVCFGEALKPEFKAYQQRVVTNARVLADALQKQGFDLVSGGTDNHLILIDLRKTGVTGKELQRRLDEVYITANKNAIPNDPESRSSPRACASARPLSPPAASVRRRCSALPSSSGRPQPISTTRQTISAEMYAISAQIFQFTNNFCRFSTMGIGFFVGFVRLHNAKLPVKNSRADKVFVRFEQNACLFPSVCYT